MCAVDQVRSSDELQVESVTAGAGRWRVTGSPQVVITRRLGRAAVVPVERLAEPPPPETT